MENGKTWTCQQLQDVVQDVRPSSSAQEARHCLDHQVIAELYGCKCNGPSVESLLNGPFKDKNPSCSLCAEGDFNYVPAFRIDSTVRIPNAGAQNCGGLFDAALNGNVLSKNQCAAWTAVFSEQCCSLPGADDIGYNSNPPPPAPSPTPSGSNNGACRSGKAELVVKIRTDKWPEDTAWSLRSSATGRAMGSGYNYKLANSVYSNSVCINEGEEYKLTFHDIYGDGLCCSWGQGWYKATLNGRQIASGDSFGKKIEYIFKTPSRRRQLRQRATE
jgi:hypothetical protein